MMFDTVTNEKKDNIATCLYESLEEGVFHFVRWHSKFNVYTLNTHDVFLVSSSQQWLLTSQQFPFFYLINNDRKISDIHECIQMHYASIEDQFDDSFTRQAMTRFVEQMTQLIEQGLLLVKGETVLYCLPNYKKNDRADPRVKHVSIDLQLIILSELPEAILDEWVTGLHTALQMLKAVPHSGISLVLVDDMLDPQVEHLHLKPSFFVIQIDPERIWLSPCFERDNIGFFTRFQRRLLSNQPVKVWLERMWPHSSHAYPVLAEIPEVHSSAGQDKVMATISLNIRLLMQKQLMMDEDVLWVYDPLDNLSTPHPVNRELKTRVLFYPELQMPIKLAQDTTNLTSEGGLRVVNVHDTVNNLMTLVSPITGVINHITRLVQDNSSPIHIYKTGFFRPSNTPQQQDHERFVQICLGKGISIEQSKASGLSEAIERYCAIYQKELPLLLCSTQVLRSAKLRYFDFQRLNPLSEAQYASSYANKRPRGAGEHKIKRYHGKPIHWLPSWSLTYQEWVYFPMSLGASQLPFDDMQYGRWQSNGCAAGNTVEEAILQGLFEVIERDAVAIWWYNRLVFPEFELSRIDESKLSKVREALLPSAKYCSQDEGYEFWVLDLTHDIGIPVMAAIGQHVITGKFILGFGCHLLPEIAAERALTELCQLQLIAHRHSAPFDFNTIVEGSYLFPDDEVKPIQNGYRYSPPFCEQHHQTLNVIIEELMMHLKTLGFEICVYNYSQGDIKLKTVKVLVPGLCHIWPQLGNPRLYTLPVQLGFRAKMLDENSINQHWLYI
ncbi:YcaO-like family protein [uncultured Shewanella sp.]|uniref:YcaO-like family protein n=1 Tax=uncultured Shewanella sp. TaxID=173975 RepID=UPI00262C6165|nr:YcaO-like family protein [uncultured Shewanella sp.]